MSIVSLAEISQRLDTTFFELTGIELPTSELERQLNEKEAELRPLIQNNLADGIMLYDIGVCTLIEIHNIFVTLNKETKEHLSYVVLTAKMCTLALSIRKMLMAGMVDSLKCLQRPLLETVDLFYACLINTDLSKMYGNTSGLYDNKEFWKRNLKDRKLMIDIRNLFRTLEADNDAVRQFFRRRTDAQEFLSNSLHGSFNAAFSNYMMINIDFSGVSTDIFGKVTTAYPKILLDLLQEILIVIETVEVSIMKRIPSLKALDVSKFQIYRHYSFKYQELYLAVIPKVVEMKGEIEDGYKHIKEEAPIASVDNSEAKD
jgi:hypothetical protein